MTASGTYTFNPENVDLITDAWERCGKDRSAMTGDLARSARMSLDLMFASWSNRHINLWAVEPVTLPLLANTPSYTLPDGTIDIMDAYITPTATGRDRTIGRMSDFATYNALPNKLQIGQPVQFYVRRGIAPSLYVWMVPSANGLFTLTYWRLRRIQDVGAAADNPDVTYQWLDAIAAGLAARLARKWAPDRVESLKTEADEAFKVAAGENRQRGPMLLLPDVANYRVLR